MCVRMCVRVCVCVWYVCVRVCVYVCVCPPVVALFIPCAAGGLRSFGLEPDPLVASHDVRIIMGGSVALWLKPPFWLKCGYSVVVVELGICNSLQPC